MHTRSITASTATAEPAKQATSDRSDGKCSHGDEGQTPLCVVVGCQRFLHKPSAQVMQNMGAIIPQTDMVCLCLSLSLSVSVSVCLCLCLCLSLSLSVYLSLSLSLSLSGVSLLVSVSECALSPDQRRTESPFPHAHMHAFLLNPLPAAHWQVYTDSAYYFDM